MTKRLVYIACIGICLPFLVSAGGTRASGDSRHKHFINYFDSAIINAPADTTIKKTDDKKKIKEVTKARQVPKPEKVDGNDKVKKRQRRPPGLERPPEIPRHNGG